MENREWIMEQYIELVQVRQKIKTVCEIRNQRVEIARLKIVRRVCTDSYVNKYFLSPKIPINAKKKCTSFLS